MTGTPASGPRKPIGEILVQKGYLKRSQLETALRLQAASDARGEPHKLIGIILLEQGMISSAQLIETLQEYESRRTAGGTPPISPSS